MDRKNYNEYLNQQVDTSDSGVEDFSIQSRITSQIKQHKQFAPSLYYSEGKFILTVTLEVDGETLNVPFELGADQVANLNAQCAKSLAPYVYYDLRREVSK